MLIALSAVKQVGKKLVSELQHHPLSIGRSSSPITFDLVEIAGLWWGAKFRILFVSLVTMAIAIFIAFNLPRAYVAQGEVVVRAEALVAPDSDRAFNATAVNEAVVATERSVLAAEGLLTRVSEQVVFPPNTLSPSWLSKQIERLRAYLRLPAAPTIDADRELQAAKLAYLKKAVGTAVEKGSSVIAVVASTGDPYFSSSIVNHLLDDYMADRVVAQKAVAENVEVALQKRLRQTSDQIAETQQKISELVQLPGLIEGSEIPGQQRDLTAVTVQLSQARRDVAEKRAAYDAVVSLKNKAGNDPVRLAELLDNGSQSASELRRQYAQKRQELAGLASRFGADYPPLAVIKSQVASIAAQLGSEGARVVAQRKADFDAASQVLATLTARLATVRETTVGDSNTSLGLLRARDSLANLQRIAGTIEDRLIAVASQPVDANARVLTAAVTPLTAAFPNKPLITVVGFVVGLVIASVTVIVRGFKRYIRRSALDQAALLPGPMLGCVPRGSKRQHAIAFEGTNRQGGRKPDLFNLAFDGAALELETAIRRGKHRVLAITSALPKEGKTTAVDALAVRLAQFDRKVLLINCDLHVDGSFANMARKPMRLRSGGEASLFTLSPTLHHLEFPPVGNTVAFLKSADFREILASARAEYDLVICDTPPALSVPDALIVVRLADAVVLVSEYRQSAQTADLDEFSRRIEATGTPVCGVILTKVERHDTSYAAYLGYATAPHRQLMAQSGS
jgi:uncharacterized protein involved in exopolysaccharide biosynthesis/Mrp family chromosome partitioning ATPase